MADVHTPEQRSFNMSRIQGRNTKPELALRKALWSAGARYRLRSKLPGRPDLVFPGRKVAVFVDGCFWHKCPKHFQWPATNRAKWKRKISRNVERDQEVNKQLSELGWTVIRIWEHEIRKAPDQSAERIILALKTCKVRPR